MKKTSKLELRKPRLKLSRETVRSLETHALELVRGGHISITCDITFSDQQTLRDNQHSER